MSPEASVDTTAIETDKYAVIDVTPLGVWVPALKALFRLGVALKDGAESNGILRALRRHCLCLDNAAARGVIVVGLAD
jgi:hypothetical protein